MTMNNPFNQRQTKPDALTLKFVAGAMLFEFACGVKPVEDPRQIDAGDPDSVVTDHNLQKITLPVQMIIQVRIERLQLFPGEFVRRNLLGFDFNSTAVGGVFNRIFQQIGKDPTDHGRVSQQRRPFSLGGEDQLKVTFFKCPVQLKMNFIE